jgi:hypothetical protein
LGLAAGPEGAVAQPALPPGAPGPPGLPPGPPQPGQVEELVGALRAG